jgi:hypothetical protein
MDLIGGDQQDIPSLHRVRSIAFPCLTLTFEDVNFMLIGVMVPGGVPTRLQFKLPHRKIRRSIGLADQPSHLALGCPFHLDFLKGNIAGSLHFHGVDSPSRGFEDATDEP